MNLLDVEWQSQHYTQIDMDDIYNAVCKRMKKEKRVPIAQIIDEVISAYVSCLDDEYYYSWNEDAQKQVREAVLKHFGGEQLSMFD